MKLFTDSLLLFPTNTCKYSLTYLSVRDIQITLINFPPDLGKLLRQCINAVLYVMILYTFL